MTQVTWIRRGLVRWLAVAMCLSALPLGARPAGADAAAGGSPPRDREARRRWALARMDEMAGERLRCRERFKEPRLVHECETSFDRRRQAYNAIYMEASRE
jgi:hypothetical protein